MATSTMLQMVSTKEIVALKKTPSTIAKLNKPTLFVMEGGYAVEAIGINTVNVLEGFLNA